MANAKIALEDHKKPVNPFSLNIPIIIPAIPNKKNAKNLSLNLCLDKKKS